MDTVITCFQRQDITSQITQAITTKTKPHCQVCRRRGHHYGLCQINKELQQKRHLKLSHNPRKDNQNGPYANHAPFHLLTDTLKPQEVFEEYNKRFIPFFRL